MINFLYSIELYKEECPLSLIFGQLLAEMYGSDLTIFVSELRMMVQEEVGKNLIKHVSNKPSLDTYKIPFKKIRKIISVFLSKGTMIEHSVESFMQLLIEKHPSLKIDFCVSYKDFLHFTADLFIHKRQVSKNQNLGYSGYNSVNKNKPKIATQTMDNVVFMDDYDIFKTKNMQSLDEDYQDLIEICKFKIAELAPYMLKADLGAVNSKTITVNADYWAKLPDGVKDALQAVAIEYRDHVAGIAMDRAEASRDAYVEAGGTIVEVSAEDRAAWANAMPNVAQEWAANLNKRGEAGSDMLAAYLGKLAAAGHEGVRDWTQE